jgi:hypothetical protein
LILEIFYQLWAFILVTIYTIVSLGIIYNTLWLGYFKETDTSAFKLEWMLLFFIVVVNPLIILNLFISIVGNALEKIQGERNVKDQQEMAEMLFEAEILFFWKRKQAKRKFLHMCDEEHAHVIVLNSISEKIRATAQKTEIIGKVFRQNSEEISLLRETMDITLKGMENQVDLVMEAVKSSN